MTARPRTLLIVDDVEEMRDSLVELLSYIEGFEVVGCAPDGAVAVRMAHELSPDIVLMDLRMPEMNGVDATREIKSRHPETSVLIHSAYGEDSLVAEALTAGADGYVLKGGSVRDLASALAAIVANQGFLSDGVSRPIFQRLVEMYGQERAHRDEAESRAHQMSELYAKERDAADRLREADEMKNGFLIAISHELRTPLTSILGGVHTLRHGAGALTPGEREELLDLLLRNAKKLDHMLIDLLDVSRMRTVMHEAVRQEVHLLQFALPVVAGWSAESGRRVGVSGDDVVANVEPAKIERILENLLWNAAKHAPEATIGLRIERSSEVVTLIVEDDGPGVPDDIKESIFEPFVRGNTAPKHSPGTGVGLALVRQFARMHGGTAWVQDRPGGGASFRVAFPA